MKLTLEVGDLVEITLPDGKLVYDRVSYIGDNEIGGTKYDLTYADFKIVTVIDNIKFK